MSAKNEFITILEAIERDKGIPREEILRLIEGALASALLKHIGREIPVNVRMDGATGDFQAAILKKVSAHCEDSITQVSLAEAKKLDPEAKLDQEMYIPVDAGGFSRIAAQTAKQVILQKLREVEKENLFKDFKKKENLIITGSIYRMGAERSVLVSLGKIEAILRREDQIPGERFAIGQPLKALVRSVEASAKGPQVFLSRSAPEFVKSLLRLEVPEVHDGTVEILQVAREPGVRCKVLVRSNDPRVDPVGACVGIKGTRIRPVINELGGEKIDLIPDMGKTEDLLAAAMAPAKVTRVAIEDGEKKTARISVDEDQAAGAIGKGSINLKLANQLTGWNLVVEALKSGQGSAKESPSTGKGPAAKPDVVPAPSQPGAA